MKPRYNYVINQNLTGGATFENESISFDLKRLLPLSDRKKQFLIYSSFNTTSNWGTTAYASIVVSTTLFSKQYKKDYTVSDYAVLGVATPRLCFGTTNYMYSYQTNECNPIVFDFPDSNYDSSTFVVRIENLNAQNLPNAGGYILTLSFVEI